MFSQTKEDIVKNDKYSKRELLGWLCLWGLIATLLTSKDAEAREPLQVPIFNDVAHAKDLGTLELLTTNLYHEARNQPDIANFIIMAVVERRKDLGGRYGNTYEEVVLKPHAFSWTFNGVSDRMYEEDQYHRLYEITERFLANKQVYMELAQGADHYVKVGHTTNWDYSKLVFLFQVGDHLFYKHK